MTTDDSLIYAVDDDPSSLNLVCRSLERAGFRVEVFQTPGDLIERTEAVEPALIVADVVMPAMTGFDLKAAYTRRYPDRRTPFIFLSALSSTDDIIRGLEAGVDDYVTKPFDVRLLPAKVASLLRRKAAYTRPTFHGDLGKFPFIKVLQFCEANGLSGDVRFRCPGLDVSIPFHAGAIDTDNLDGADDVIPKLYDVASGTFSIHVRPSARFEALRRYAVDGVEEPSEGRPMGRLSGVAIGGRLFQVQTEGTREPTPHVVTIVQLDGRTLLKRSVDAPPGGRAVIEAAIAAQHEAVEEELRSGVDRVLKGRKEEADGRDVPAFRYYELFDAGLDAFQRGALMQAIELWEQARAINPGDRTLETNLSVARARLTVKVGTGSPPV